MKALDTFFNELPSLQREYIFFLHQWLTEQIKLEPKINWNIPFYYKNSWICYLNPLTEDSLEFCFLKGNKLVKHQELLNAKGRKQIRGIELDCREEPPHFLEQILDEAIELDQSIHLKTRAGKLG
jgi:hypothetical protein